MKMRISSGSSVTRNVSIPWSTTSETRISASSCPAFQHAPDRTRVATHGGGRFVDALVAFQEFGLLDVAVGGHPSVGDPADDRQHPRPVGAEPDADRVLRHRTGMRTRKTIELALEADAVLSAPQKAHHLDGFLDRGHGLAGRPHRPVVRLDPVS